MESLKSGAEVSDRESMRGEGGGRGKEKERWKDREGERKFHLWTTTLAHTHGFQASLDPLILTAFPVDFELA